jgi:hypothetical protein
MIVTIERQEVDKENRLTDFVYMEVMDIKTNRRLKTVTVEIEQYLLREIETLGMVDRIGKKQDYTEAGTPIFTDYVYQEEGIIIKPEFILRKKREAIFKEETFYKHFGFLTPDQYDAALITQIDFINRYQPHGNELQKELFYWELKAQDMKILTPGEIAELLKPRNKE